MRNEMNTKKLVLVFCALAAVVGSAAHGADAAEEPMVRWWEDGTLPKISTDVTRQEAHEQALNAQMSELDEEDRKLAALGQYELRCVEDLLWYEHHTYFLHWISVVNLEAACFEHANIQNALALVKDCDEHAAFLERADDDEGLKPGYLNDLADDLKCCVINERREISIRRDITNAKVRAQQSLASHTGKARNAEIMRLETELAKAEKHKERVLQQCIDNNFVIDICIEEAKRLRSEVRKTHAERDRYITELGDIAIRNFGNGERAREDRAKIENPDTSTIELEEIMARGLHNLAIGRAFFRRIQEAKAVSLAVRNAVHSHIDEDSWARYAIREDEGSYNVCCHVQLDYPFRRKKLDYDDYDRYSRPEGVFILQWSRVWDAFADAFASASVKKNSPLGNASRANEALQKRWGTS
jgi:hypothetical protein